MAVLEERADWLRVCGIDGYEGWTHRGYLAEPRGDEREWHWVLGCRVRGARGPIELPVGARIAPERQVLSGAAITADERALRFPADFGALPATAELMFGGASYMWGGVTPWGVDCSGLVQRTARLHGIPLPRDAWQQAAATMPIANEFIAESEPGDLLFFSDRDDRKVTHVGISLGGNDMIHSSLARGGVAIENMAANDAYVSRLRQQCTGVHRLMEFSD